MAETYSINNRFARDTNRITGKLLRRSIVSSVWTRLVLKETFPRGMGDTLKVITVGRNLPSNPDNWEDVAIESTGACVPTENQIGHGYDEATFAMKQMALTSIPICVDTTYGADRVMQQAAAMLRNLEQASTYVWKRKAINDYITVSKNHFVAAAGFPKNETTWPSVEPTSVLTQKMLNVIYTDLIAEGAEMDGGSLGRADGGRPQFILVTSAEASNEIMRETGSNNINAFLYNEKRVPELLQPLGVERVIRGFYHYIDNLPPRFTYSGGTFTEVHPYESVAATSGTRLKIRQAYREAPYEASFVYLPTVFSWAVPQPTSTVGSKTKWNPQSYMGEWQWLNIQDRDDNPLNQIGFYYGLLRCAVKPGIPEFGYCIMHKRCFADLDLTGCDETGSDATSSLLGSDDSYFVV